MPDVTVTASALARGDRVIIEGDIDPITPISALRIVSRRQDAPAGIMLTVELLAPRAFWWARRSTGDPITVGSVARFERPAGFQFDVFGQFGADNRLMVVYDDPARDRCVVTRGFYLVDWPG